MAGSKAAFRNQLVERMVRNEDIFCSLLFDDANKTMRVVDFRGGNFQSKHAFLERVLLEAEMRKVFTLIERDDMNGWSRVGYRREGAIPGYYKRSDAYIMSKVYGDDADGGPRSAEDTLETKAILADIKARGKELAEQRSPSFKVAVVSEEEAILVLDEEIKRRLEKNKGKKTKAARVPKLDKKSMPPIFPQFSRQVEFFYFVVQNRRTKLTNLIGAEYQDCFGNAKVSLFFPPKTKPEQSLARRGIEEALELLVEAGAVSMFALVPASEDLHSAVYAAAGFRNSGWMSQQRLTADGPEDAVLWTRKLI
jgi:hypothetical protein